MFYCLKVESSDDEYLDDESVSVCAPERSSTSTYIPGCVSSVKTRSQNSASVSTITSNNVSTGTHGSEQVLNNIQSDQASTSTHAPDHVPYKSVG